MFIISVAPLTKIPLPARQTLTYFYLAKLKRGSIVLVSLKNRELPGVVLSCEKLSPLKKFQLKKSADFMLKKIKKVLCQKPFLAHYQIKIAQEIARYYYEPLGLCLKLFIPSKILKDQSFKKFAIAKEFKPSKPRQSIEFLKYDFNKEILLKKIRENDAVTLFIASDLIAAQNWADYLKKYFEVVLIHSKFSPQKRLEAWQKSQALKSGVIIGTKTAFWQINASVRLIILQNASSDYHKAWDQHPRYDIRTLVKLINRQLGIKVILSDSAMSIDNYPNIQNNIIDLAPSEYVNLKSGQDFIEEKSIFSQVLIENLKAVVLKNNRAILYLNQKGYAKVILCASCAYVPKCQNCALALNLIKNKLICSSCAFTQEAPNVCEKCQSHRFIYFKLGTDFIEENIRRIFPGLKIFRFDLNYAPTFKDQVKIIKNFYLASPAVLIGTSLLFKITPDFYKKVALASVLNIDYDLFLPDYQAREKTFLNLLKLRAISDKLVIQSFQDKLEIFDYQKEYQIRKLLKYPPDYKIIKITIRASKGSVLSKAKMLFNFLKSAAGQLIKKFGLKDSDIIIQGPIRNFKKSAPEVYQIIAKFSQSAFQYKNQLLQLIPIKVDIDVEPKSLF